MSVGDYLATASAVVAAGALVYAARALRQAQIANAFPVVADVLKEYRETADDRHFIINEIGNFDPQGGYQGLPDDARARVMRVSHYLDSLGLLVEQGLADEHAISGFVGDSILRLWCALSPFIKREREIREQDYQAYFEHLAVRVRDVGPARVREKLSHF